MYSNVTQYTPLKVREESPHYKALMEKASQVISKGAHLEGQCHRVTRKALSKLVSVMNCYYSNMMEGVDTLPLEIEKNIDSLERSQGKLSMIDKISSEVALTQWSQRSPIKRGGLISWLSDAHLMLDGSLEHETTAGKLRDDNVTIGGHTPPRWESVPDFVRDMDSKFIPADFSEASKLTLLIEGFCLHQKFEWVHPFLDGNGRVGRALLDRWMKDAGIPGVHLWSMSRGFARNDKGGVYKGLLANADMPRNGDLDGRGNLSERQLAKFVEFCLESAADQALFMGNLFDLDGFGKRALRCFQALGVDYPVDYSRVYTNAFIKGEVERGEVQYMTAFSERKSRDILKNLIDLGFLTSDTPKGAVRCAFPVASLGLLIPNLFPQAALPEMSISSLKEHASNHSKKKEIGWSLN